ncbi:HEAT repeat domain-containing protein [Anabaena azotica]|uniref:HEAT repeat domain-containing protein n=1 Tax=Anabaena azotica FACHB-119 TaxID=947527 RepID=A0ABR8DEB0_9NOST|nr:HEAT repeat domain-containing protein [Anabaena azotica]MBD2504838.1 HEAT repeat domain-containing protein [Anabaena azotica FACHB-119]
MSIEIATLAVGLGKAVFPVIAKQMITKVNSLLNPTDLEKALQAGVKAAVEWDATQPYDRRLFYHCDDKQTKEVLDQFFKDTGVQGELLKPINNKTTPNLELLIAAFKKIFSEKPKLKFPEQSIENWLQKFTDAYFKQTNTYLQFQLAKNNYLQQLSKYFDDVEFVGLKVATKEEERFAKLPQIFVMPDVVEQVDSRESISLEFFNREGVAGYNRQSELLNEQRISQLQQSGGRRFSAQELIKQSTSGKSVLLGEPGIGKTTLLSYFALMLAEKQAEKLGLTVDIDLLPILIKIRDLAKASTQNILEYVRDFAKNRLYVKELPTGFFEHWLEDGRALILLDGLDEVADAGKRYQFVKNIETFLGQYSQNRAIITSRPAGYSRNYFRTDNFTHYKIEKFDDSQIDLFIQKWYESRLLKSPEEARERQESLKKALAEQERIKLLARNPLILTIIALIHRYQAHLPRQRYELYKLAVDTLLINWEEVKDIDKLKLDYIQQSDIRELMNRLAYWIHSQGQSNDKEGGTLIDKDELIRELCKHITDLNYQVKPHQAKAEAERFVDYIRERSGLLNEQGQDRYAFVHKTFQEYLTAEEIRERQEESFEVVLDHVREHLHDPHWREVLLLLIAQQKRSNPKKVIEAILQQDTLYEQWLHRNLFFAGSCLAEDLQLSDSDLITQLVNIEVSDDQRVGGKIKSQVFKILCSLRETKFQAQALQLLKASADLIDERKLLEYRLTLGEQEKVLAELLALLQDESESVRYSAAWTLGNLGKATPEVVAQLLTLLHDKSEPVRYGATEALGNLGKATPEVVAKLLALLHDKNDRLRYSVAEALGNLGKATPEVVAKLLALLHDKSELVRYSAAGALGKLGKATPEVVAKLLALLEDKSERVRSSAVEALGNLGKAKPEVVAQLLALLHDKSELVRSSAVEALSDLGKDKPEVVAQLLALLHDKSELVRGYAVSALSNLGKDKPEVVAQLLALLHDKSELVRSFAAEALGKLGKDTPEVVSQLLALLYDESNFVRSSAVGALGKLGKDKPEVVAQLLALLHDESESMRSSAAWALGKLGKNSPDITANVVEWILQHQDSEYVGTGIDVLWDLVVGEF